MTSNVVYHLSNLSARQEFDLTVAEGADVLKAAQSHLEESGLYGEAQHGFYISVYPRQPDGDAPAETTTIAPADAPSTGGGLEEDEAILA